MCDARHKLRGVLEIYLKNYARLKEKNKVWILTSRHNAEYKFRVSNVGAAVRTLTNSLTISSSGTGNIICR